MKAGIMNELSGVKCFGGEWRKKRIHRGKWKKLDFCRRDSRTAIRIQTMTDVFSLVPVNAVSVYLAEKGFIRYAAISFVAVCVCVCVCNENEDTRELNGRRMLFEHTHSNRSGMLHPGDELLPKTWLVLSNG